MKRHTLLVGVACLLVIAGIAKVRAQKGPEGNSDSEHSKIQIGFRITPVPLKMEGLNPSLVGLGSYIVNAQADCNGCHSNPQYEAGGDPHLGQPERISQAGYLIGGSDLFGPDFRPRNLTPNGRGLPAGFTLERFLETINTGADLKNRAPHIPSDANDLLQIMPWPIFSKMTERDKTAIYEYLRAIPCYAPPDNPNRCNP